MNFVVVITARGGSKRLPGKNLLKFGDNSLLGHSILFVKKNFSNLRVFVSTDHDKIISEALAYGAEVIKRPAELATDFSSSAEVLLHCLSYFDFMKVECDAIILLQPTNPFRFIMDIKAAMEQFIHSKRGSLVTVSLNKKKICKVSNDNTINWLYEPGSRSQDLKEHYFENGNFYITSRKIVSEGKIISSDSMPFIQNSPLCIIDIDTIEDYNCAISLIPTYLENLLVS
jgi:CMP-N-acetylneuraminic acid synthetase